MVEVYPSLMSTLVGAVEGPPGVRRVSAPASRIVTRRGAEGGESFERELAGEQVTGSFRPLRPWQRMLTILDLPQVRTPLNDIWRGLAAYGMPPSPEGLLTNQALLEEFFQSLRGNGRQPTAPWVHQQASQELSRPFGVPQQPISGVLPPRDQPQPAQTQPVSAEIAAQAPRAQPQIEGEVAAVLRAGSQRLERLLSDRERAPRTAELTESERDLLALFGIQSMSEIERRMVERATLSAQDGTTAPLTERRSERAAVRVTHERSLDGAVSRVEVVQEGTSETALVYEPAAGHVRLRQSVTWVHRQQEEAGAAKETRVTDTYEALVNARTGQVLQRQYGTIQRTPDSPEEQRNVITESTIAEREATTMVSVPPLSEPAFT